jgi:hypothetical protein
MSEQATETVNVELARATALLEQTIAAAKKARPNARNKDLVAVDMELRAPYTKPFRLIAGEIARSENVFAVGVPVDPKGGYRKGVTVTLYGFKADVARAQERFDATRTLLMAALEQPWHTPGEDIATYRESFLLGARQGLRVGDFTQEQVEAAVATPERVEGSTWHRSTGSGAWLGFEVVRGGWQPAQDDDQADAETEQEPVLVETETAETEQETVTEQEDGLFAA